jgi:type I restriction enzyme M protein
MFHGFDFDATMLRIAAMNLILHGVDNPDDPLPGHAVELLSREVRAAGDGRVRCHAGESSPFKGSLDASDVHPSADAGKVNTKKTELLFVALVLRMLKKGGRSATIVPDGVLFGSSKAHVALRRVLVEENQLEAVISLPIGGVQAVCGGVDGDPGVHPRREDRPGVLLRCGGGRVLAGRQAPEGGRGRPAPCARAVEESE